MQTVSKDGILGSVKAFTEENMKKALEDKDVDHVDVFPGTPENIAHRKSMEGQKYNKLSGRYRKTGSNKKR